MNASLLAPAPDREDIGVPSPRVGLVRNGIGLTAANLGTFVLINAMGSVLLPTVIADSAGESGKESWYGVVTSAAAVVALFVSMATGILSDRTRSRLGRRAPWVLGGALGVAGAMTLLGLATGPWSILVVWCLVQACVAALQAALGPVIAERVPLHRRGLLSAVSALVTSSAAIGAGFLGAMYVHHPASGFLVLAAFVLTGAVLFVVVAPDHPSRGAAAAATAAREPGPSVWRGLLTVFQVPNLRWTWLGRFLVTLAYQLIQTRMLYLLQDRFGLGLDDAATAVATITASAGLFTVVGLVVSGPLSDRFGRRPFVYFGGVGCAVGFALAVFTGTQGQFTIAWAVVSLSFGAFMGVDAALAADVLPDVRDAARDLSLINTANTLPQTFAPVLGSVLLGAAGGEYTVLLVIAVVASFLAVPVTARLKGVR
ncbi:MFS transporter [Streptomyces sp. NPDC051016]|uniref:MFS transporter n=1 Tax=Streptomyces sp. NPDC051016 TaxID=3365638 RepID=UPI0037AE3B39